MLRSHSGILWGLLLILIGALMILDRVGVIYFDFGEFLHTWWPLALVVVGLNMVLTHRSANRRRKET